MGAKYRETQWTGKQKGNPMHRRKQKGNRMDGKTKRIKWMVKHKSNRKHSETQRDLMEGEAQRESNGWENTNVIELMGEHKGIE